MPKIMETKSFIRIFNLENVTNDDFPTATLENIPKEKYLMFMYDQYLEKVKEWAERNYPEAAHKDCCSFAGLVLYYATGAYGGYGTELYEKERIAERKINAFYNQNFRTMSAQDMTQKLVDLCVEYILK